MTDSVITDVQQAGLTMVTGGGYSASDVIPGHWALVRRTVFIGHTQEQKPIPDHPTVLMPDNRYAADGGPFNPYSGLRCAQDAAKNRPGNYCMSLDEGVSFQMSNFGMYQRLFSVYDGPAFQESNAYLNIKRREIDDCTPFTDVPNKVGRCQVGPEIEKEFRQSAWIAGIVQGLPLGRRDRLQSGRPRVLHAECRHRVEAAERVLLSAGVPLGEPVFWRGRRARAWRRRRPPFRGRAAVLGGHADHRHRQGEPSSTASGAGRCSPASPATTARPCSTTTTGP